MAPSSLPPLIISLLRNPQSTSLELATDALEEFIWTRRAKGDTLFEVSILLIQLEDECHPSLLPAFAQARYQTHLPSASDLTPPMGHFPLARSKDPSTILQHLLSYPTPTLEHSREVILEYVLARESKLKEKKPGKGGKGTIAREHLEEIGKRMGELEAGIPTDGRDADEEDALAEMRALVLSLRLSLSYFTLPELAEQLSNTNLPLAMAERTLVQHVRRRVQGEGRWGVGRELASLELMTQQKRPALRPAYRSAKLRTYLPSSPTYPITLPAPNKTHCIKLIHLFLKNPSSVAVGAGPPSPTSNKRGEGSPSGSALNFGSGSKPSTPTTHHYTSSSSTALSSQFSPAQGTSGDATAAYVYELLSEYITREKREHMLKCRWAKSGRDALAKEFNEIEHTFCVGGASSAAEMLPTFIKLRRDLALPPSPLPPALLEQFEHLVAAPPEGDEVPLRETTVQSATGALYQNPRLSQQDAVTVLTELVEAERERGEWDVKRNENQWRAWIEGVLEAVENRFPDNSYTEAFATMRMHLGLSKSLPSTPLLLRDEVTEQSGSSTPLSSGSSSPAQHRRAQSSNAQPPRPAVITQLSTGSVSNAQGSQVHSPSHLRSASLPYRSISVSTIATTESYSTSTTTNAEEPLSAVEPMSAVDPSKLDGGWWDIVSGISPTEAAPWQTSPNGGGPGLLGQRNFEMRDSLGSLASQAMSDSTTGSPGVVTTLSLPPGAAPSDPAVGSRESPRLAPALEAPSPPASSPHSSPLPAVHSPSSRPTYSREPSSSLRLDFERLNTQQGGPMSPTNTGPTTPPVLAQIPSPLPSPPPSSSPTKPRFGFGRFKTSDAAAAPAPSAGNTKPSSWRKAIPATLISGSAAQRQSNAAPPPPPQQGPPAGRSHKVMNDPGTWRRNVSDIMGPPAAQRRS